MWVGFSQSIRAGVGHNGPHAAPFSKMSFTCSLDLLQRGKNVFQVKQTLQICSCPAALNDESRLIIPWKQCFPLMYWTVAACQGLFCHIELKMFLQCIAVHSSVSVPAGSRGGVDWWSERRGDKRCFSLTNGAKHVRYLLCTVVFWVHYEALDTQEYSATHLVCFYGRPRSIK